MNINTAAFLLREDLVALKVSFEKGVSARKYTYFAGADWLPVDFEVDGLILVPSGTSEIVKVARFRNWCDLTDVDIDNEEIDYKFIVGRSLDDVDRYEQAKEENQAQIRNLKRLRVEAMRNAIRQQFLVELEEKI